MIRKNIHAVATTAAHFHHFPFGTFAKGVKLYYIILLLPLLLLFLLIICIFVLRLFEYFKCLAECDCSYNHPFIMYFTIIMIQKLELTMTFGSQFNINMDDS